MLKIPITAIILAGGQGVRMGKIDKGLQLLKGKPLYCHVIDRIKPQVDYIIVNANQHFDEYEQGTYCVVRDEIPGFLGPLAGIYSGLTHSKTDWNVIVSCDTPFLPTDLVSRLENKTAGKVLTYVFDGEKTHPTLLFIHRSLANEIKDYLTRGNRKLQGFLESVDGVTVDFSDKKEAFININTTEELAYWNSIL